MPDETPNEQEDKQLPVEVNSYKRDDEEMLSLAAVEAENKRIDDITPGASAPPSVPLASEAQSRPADFQIASVISSQPKRSKKGLIIAGVIAAVLIVLGGGGYAAYAWYQNPEKVVFDGVAKAAQAKTFTVDGTSKMSIDNGAIDIEFDTKGDAKTGYSGAIKVAVNAKDFPSLSFGGDGIYMANGDMYFRVTQVQKVYEDVINSYMDAQIKSMAEAGTKITPTQKREMRKMVDQMFMPVLQKIDNQWVKVSAADIKEVDNDSGRQYECAQDVFEKASTDKEFGKQLRELYMKHKVLDIKELGKNKGSSKGYSLTINESKVKAFGDDAKQLPLYKELKECLDVKEGEAGAVPKSTDEVTGSFDVWIDQWSHEITSFSVEAYDSRSKSQVTTEGTTQFNKPVTITAPKDAKSIKDFKKELENIMQTMAPTEASDSLVV